MINRIGIDLGGTKIEGILLKPDFSVQVRRRIPTNSEEGYESIVSRIGNLVLDLIRQAEYDYTVGICTPGAISAQSGRIKNSNTTCLIDQPLKEDIEVAVNHPILMENDANCFVLAEALMGAGKGVNTVFGVIMGTGVGGGITVNGQVLAGRSNIAGEWGHHKIVPDGRKCYCGEHGCVETYISGPALERRWEELTGEKKSLTAIVAGLNSSGNAQLWKDEFEKYFGIALANVINILDPDIIVLGGGLSNINFLYDDGAASVYKYVFNDFPDTPIVRNLLGDSAGVFGAAMLGEL